MKEKTASLAAGCVALAMVGGLGALGYHRSTAPRLGGPPPKFISQHVIPASSNSPAVLELKVLPPPPRPLHDSPGDSEAPLDFRVVDARGRVYATAQGMGTSPVSLSIPLGYGRPVEGPRLIASFEGEFRGSLVLPSFPKPVFRSLKAHPDPRIKAYLDDRRDWMGRITLMLAVRPLMLIPKGEVWTARVLETNLGSGPMRPNEGYLPQAGQPSAKADGPVGLGGAPGPPSAGLRDLYSAIPNARTGEFLFVPEYGEGLSQARIRVTRLRTEVRKGLTVEKMIGSFEATVPLELMTRSGPSFPPVWMAPPPKMSYSG